MKYLKNIQEYRNKLAREAGLNVLPKKEDEEQQYLGTDEQWNNFQELLNKYEEFESDYYEAHKEHDEHYNYK